VEPKPEGIRLPTFLKLRPRSAVCFDTETEECPVIYSQSSNISNESSKIFGIRELKYHEQRHDIQECITTNSATETKEHTAVYLEPVISDNYTTNDRIDKGLNAIRFASNPVYLID